MIPVLLFLATDNCWRTSDVVILTCNELLIVRSVSDVRCEGTTSKQDEVMFVSQRSTKADTKVRNINKFLAVGIFGCHPRYTRTIIGAEWCRYAVNSPLFDQRLLCSL